LMVISSVEKPASLRRGLRRLVNLQEAEELSLLKNPPRSEED